jgi:hypothetical protein
VGGVQALGVVSPFLVSRYTHAYPPHPKHLPKRIGLFTIIVTGEDVAPAQHSLLLAEHPKGRCARAAEGASHSPPSARRRPYRVNF